MYSEQVLQSFIGTGLLFWGAAPLSSVLKNVPKSFCSLIFISWVSEWHGNARPALIIPCLASVTLRLDLKSLWRGFEGAKEEEKRPLERNHISHFSVLPIHWETIHTDPPASLSSLRPSVLPLWPHLSAWEEIVSPALVPLGGALKGNKRVNHESLAVLALISFGVGV